MMKINPGRIFVTALLIAALLMTYRLVSFGEGLSEPAFTTFSTGSEGAALFYDSLRIMGFPVTRDTIFLSAERPVNNVQIIIAPQFFDDELLESMIAWVIHGGSLLFFSQQDSDVRRILSTAEPDLATPAPGGIMYRVGLGRLFIGSATYITNAGLFEGNGRYGQQMVDMLNTLEFNRIYFNEAYHGFTADMSFAQILPLPIRLIGAQIGLVTLGFVLYRGIRFGKPLPFYEEIQREENEYVFTLSNLYMSVGLGNAALEVYDKKLLKTAADYFKTPFDADYYQIYELWKAANKPHLGKLEYIIENREEEFYTKGRSGKKNEFIKMIKCYKELLKELKK